MMELIWILTDLSWSSCYCLCDYLLQFFLVQINLSLDSWDYATRYDSFRDLRCLFDFAAVSLGAEREYLKCIPERIPENILSYLKNSLIPKRMEVQLLSASLIIGLRGKLYRRKGSWSVMLYRMVKSSLGVISCTILCVCVFVFFSFFFFKMM